MKHIVIVLIFGALSLGSLGCFSDDTQPGWQLEEDFEDATVDSGDAADTRDAEPSDAADTRTPDADAELDTGSDADASADVDTDPEPIPVPCDHQTADCDADGMLDCEEEQLGTEVCDPDSDGDGLFDLDELFEGTDPLDPDSDGDGVDDGEEVEIGLHPGKQQSFGDGVNDGDRWIVGACNSQSPESQHYLTSTNADLELGLPLRFTEYAELSIAGASASNRQAALVYQGSGDEAMAGFVLSALAPQDTEGPSALLDAHRSALDASADVISEYTGAPFDSRDNHSAILARYKLRLPAAKNAQELRNELLFELAPFEQSDASGLSTADGNAYDEFHIYLSVLLRTPPSGGSGTQPQALTSLVVLPQSAHEHAGKSVSAQNAANSANIGSTLDRKQSRCHRLKAKGPQHLDLYWVIETSRTIVSHADRIDAALETFHSAANLANFDIRMGVTTMEADRDGRLRSPPGWHTSLATFTGEVKTLRQNYFDHEHGLESAQEGIEHMKGLFGANPPPELEIRPRAHLMTVFITDDEAATFQYNPLSTPAGQRKLDDFIYFFASHTTPMAVIADGDTCGDRDGVAFREVVRATGGAHTSLCDDDLAGALERWLAHTGDATKTYELPKVPVPGTIRVLIEGQYVPPSRENGFFYAPQTNSLVFYGTFRPYAGDNTTAPDFLAVSYESLD